MNLVRFYNDFVNRSGLQTTQMADYVGFLKDARFIAFFGDGQDVRVHITPTGVNFLSYVKGQYPH